MRDGVMRGFCLTRAPRGVILSPGHGYRAGKDRMIRFKSFFVIALVSALSADAQAVVMNWSAVGNAGNANDPADGDSSTLGLQNFGAVNHNYNIGTNDVTNSQYAEFLNTKDPTGANTLGLWNGNMGSLFGGINFNAGNANGNKYTLISGAQNHPVNFETWYDAIRFANWLNNGQGSGDTENGSYTLLGGTPTPSNGNSITRNAGATIFLPSENEWYKAAYYDPRTTAQGGPPSDSHYWLYGTSSSSTPIYSGPTALPNHANYVSAVGNPTAVGAYSGTTSPHSAFDMAGNVYQWNEALIFGSDRGVRGGSFDLTSNDLRSSSRGNTSPTVDYDGIFGFRVAETPEPSTGVLAGIAGAMLWVVAKAVQVARLPSAPVNARNQDLAATAVTFCGSGHRFSFRLRVLPTHSGPARVAAPGVGVVAEIEELTSDNSSSTTHSTPGTLPRFSQNHRRLAHAPRADPPGDAGLGWVGVVMGKRLSHASQHAGRALPKPSGLELSMASTQRRPDRRSSKLNWTRNKIAKPTNPLLQRCTAFARRAAIKATAANNASTRLAGSGTAVEKFRSERRSYPISEVAPLKPAFGVSIRLL